jgi:hypothetical protein
VAAFAAALALWYLLRFPYSRLVAFGGDHVLNVFAGSPEALVVVRDRQFFLNTLLVNEDGSPIFWELPMYPVSWNGILFAGILFLAPWRRLRRSWGWIIFAALLLFASHVLYMTLSCLHQVAQAYLGEHARDPERFPVVFEAETTDFLRRAVEGYYLSLGSLLPFLLLAPVFLRRERRERSEAAPGAAAGGGRRAEPGSGRNAPCPCGSGRKLKRCCGRAG